MLMTFFILQNGGNSLRKEFNYIINIYLNFSKHWIRLIMISKIKLKSCRNPSLRFVTKARAYTGVGQEGSPQVTYHVLGNVGECGGINPHTPK